MTFYEEMQSVAAGVLKEFKQGVIEYVRITPGNGPVDNPGPSTPLAFELDAVAKGVSFKYIQNSLAVASDKQVTAAAHPALIADYDPVGKVIKGFVDIDGARYKIVHAAKNPEAGTPVAFVLIVRK